MKLKSKFLAAAAPLATFAVITLTASAADLYKVNNTNDLNVLTSWSTTSGAQTPNPAAFAATDNWYFNEVTLLGDKTVVLGGDISIGGLALDYATGNTANNLQISSGSTLTLNGGTLGGSGVTGSNFTAAGIVLNRGIGGTVTINSNVALGANQSWVNGRSSGTGITIGGALNLDTRTLTTNIVSGATTAISGNISGTGAAAIVKTNSGTLTLSGTNSLTGTGDNLTINAGTVSITAGTSTFAGTIKASATSSKGTLNVSSGATVNALALFSSWGTTMAINGTMNFTNAFTFSGGTSTITGGGTVKANTLTNANLGTSNLNGARFNLGAGGYTKAADATTAINFGATTLGAYANWSSSAPMVLTSATPGTTINTLDSVDGLTARTITLSGVLSGSGALTKAGAGSLILTTTNTYSGALVVTGGTLQAGNGGTTGSFGGAGDIAVSSGATLAVNRSDAFTLGRILTGAGGFAQKGGGTTTLALAHTYTGPTGVSAGRLALSGSLTSDITVASGAKVSGTGTTTGLLALSGGSSIILAGNSATTSLTANGATFGAATSLVFDATPIAATIYDVVTYGSGTVPDFTNLTTGYRGTFADNAGARKITFTAGTVDTRTWNTTTGTWAINAGTNFVEGDQKFFNGDTVLFGNIASDSTITLTGTLIPASVTVSNAANVYAFTGGSIGGAGALVKSGDGTLELNAANSYVGGTTVNGGVLNLTGGGGAAGTIRGTATVNTGATLRLSTGDATGYDGGPASLSAINLVGGTLDVNTAANQTLGSSTITMTGASITGIAGGNLDFFGNGSALNTLASATSSTISLPTMNLRQNDTVFDIADGAAANDLLISAAIGNGSAGNHALIKNGAGTMKLTALNVFTGNVTINAGTLDLTGGAIYSNAFNNSTVTVNTGATLLLNSFAYSGTASLGQLRDYATSRVINGGTVVVSAPTHFSGNDFTVGASGATFRYNPTTGTDTLTLVGNANTNIPVTGTLNFQTDGNITVAEIIEGAGGLTKTGSQTLTLTAANTYTGTTSVSTGTLALLGGSQTSPITVASGATLGFTMGSPTTSSSTVTFSGATAKVSVSGTPASGILMTASNITGTPVLNPAIPGYTLAIQNSGTELVLNATGGANYNSWATTNGVSGQAANLDHDNDGVPNGVEYFIGGPTGNTTGFTPLPGVTTTAGVRSITWTKSATYSGTYGSDFFVETSTTLAGAWAVETLGGTVTVSGDNVTYTFPAGPVKNFVRLKVTGP